MNKINFTKMVASGNDFIVVSQLAGLSVSQLKTFAQKACDRKYGIGADGLLILEKSNLADVKMRIFNADGSEARMCGNGARCVALYIGKLKVRIQTQAGIIESAVAKDNVKIRLTDPKNMKLGIPVKINNRNLKTNFINTGVPHAVIFVEGLEEIHVAQIGRAIRNHQKFSPEGTNVDFVEVFNQDTIAMRTYERGVEDETLACGTGAVAAAIITAQLADWPTGRHKVNVRTQGKEVLKVYFEKMRNQFHNVWLEGKAGIVYTGVYNV